RPARARRSPARRPSTARRPRPAPGTRRSGPRASWPSPGGRRPPAPGRSSGPARAGAGSPPPAPAPAAHRPRPPPAAASPATAARAARATHPPAPPPPQPPPDSAPLQRRLAGQQAIQGRAEAVHVGPRPEPVDLAGGLLGAHVGRRPQRRAGERLGAAAGRRGDQRPLVGRAVGGGLADRPGPAPIHHQRLALPAHDHAAPPYLAAQD